MKCENCGDESKIVMNIMTEKEIETFHFCKWRCVAIYSIRIGEVVIGVL